MITSAEQPAEQTSTTGGTSSTRSYVLGLRPELQANGSNGTVAFVRDGHGSDRALLRADGKTLERYDYRAFGDAAVFEHIDPTSAAVTAITPAQAATVHLFGGDGEFDSASRLYYHDARWRDGFRFTSYDSYEADPSSPAAYHKYNYAGSNPVRLLDVNGHFSLTEIVTEQGIEKIVNNTLSVLKFARQVQRAGNAIQQVQIILSFVDKMSLFFTQGFVGANTPLDFAARLTNAFNSILNANVSSLQAIIPSVNSIFAFAGHEWGSWMGRIERRLPRIIADVVTDPQMVALLADVVKARGHVPLVITLPSAPAVRGINVIPFSLPEIHVKAGADELILKTDPRGGRLFQIGARLSRNFDQPILRIDYQDFDGGTLLPNLHYHTASRTHLPIP